MIRILFVGVGMFIQSVLFGQDASVNSDVESALPFSNASVTLNPSWIKHREDLNIAYLKSLDPDRLLHNFRINGGLPSNAKPLEGWEAPSIGLRGHFVGHYLSAVSCVVEKNGDAVLTKRVNYLVDELYKCQQALGGEYLSAFPEKDFDTLETRFGGVWAPYYTYQKIMQGLLDVYVRCGNRKAYEMVVGMASYVDKRMSELDEETIEKVFYSAGANPSNEAGAMSETLYKLYKVSKDQKHLSLAKIFDRDWFFIPLSENEDILSGLHSNTHLALVNGFAQRYSITKEVTYRDAVVNFWDMLIKDHAYVNGSSSGPRPNVTTQTSLTAEHWGVPGHLSNTMTSEIAESCVSHNTQKLTSTLFSWTANPKYADVYMNTFYNSVMALQSGRTGACVYHLPLGSPRNKKFLKENDFRCCNASTIEAFSLLNGGIYYHNDSVLWVNLYIPSTLSWEDKGIALTQTGNFPSDSSVEFTIVGKKKSAFTIKLLIPSWAKIAEVFINNENQNIEITPDSYVSLNREWKKNDKIRLVFHYDFYIRTMPDDKNVIAIFYGPALLAFESESELILKGDHDSIFSSLSRASGVMNTFYLRNNGRTYLLRPLFDIEDQSYGVYATIRNY
ncbi:MAG TPA: beta-L-arabinofuranosidase domain-containing protein [Cyclobacteriaceae bacterium]|nr:beta-L-arabinofuranosidase domain-containing protein [Cyclobacteriaceae bacterium]